jgi:hypothetical protein
MRYAIIGAAFVMGCSGTTDMGTATDTGTASNQHIVIERPSVQRPDYSLPLTAEQIQYKGSRSEAVAACQRQMRDGGFSASIASAMCDCVLDVMTRAMTPEDRQAALVRGYAPRALEPEIERHCAAVK